MNSLFDVSGKVAVVTGGSGVLGSNISEGLLKAGAKVAVIGAHSDRVEKALERLKATGGEVCGFTCNVLDMDSLREVKEKVLAQWGRVDILVNAAGGNIPGGTLTETQHVFDMKVEDLNKVVDLNLFGTVLPTMVFADVMANQREGAIVNFSSESALRPLTRVVGYGAAKAAISNLTKYLAGELAIKFGEGLRVNAIAPGFFLTEQNRTLMTNPDGSYTPRAESVIAHTPFRRLGTPDELFGTIQYLISDASKFVTGTIAIVDGGFDAFSI